MLSHEMHVFTAFHLILSYDMASGRDIMKVIIYKVMKYRKSLIIYNAYL